MSDRLFASEGDSVDTGRQGPTRRPTYGGGGRRNASQPHVSPNYSNQPDANQTYGSQPAYENQAYGSQPPYDSQAYGSPTNENQPYGSRPDESPLPAPQPSTSQSYGSQSYGSQSYGSQPYESQPYESQPFGSQPNGSQQYESQPYNSQSYESQTDGSLPHESLPYESLPYESERYGSQPHESPSHDSQPYGSQPYDPQRYGSQPYESERYGSQPYDSQPDTSQPYGSQSHDSQPYGSQSHDSQPYGSQSHDSRPYESQPYGSQPSESPSYEPQPYGAQPYGSEPYESPSYGSQPYEAPSHGSQPYDSQTYASQPYESPSHDSPFIDSSAYAPQTYASQTYADEPEASPPENAALGVARRLQIRLERHLELLEQLPSEYPQRRELSETARRIRRDTESIALLSGEDPVGYSKSRRLAEVLDDAASAADETWRVLVRPASAATLAPAASVELMHVLAEVIDHVTAAYPDAGVGVASYLGARTGVSVEVSVNGANRYTPDGLGSRRAAGAAAAHASRSRAGITVNHPAAGPPQSGSGLVASVSCPAASVTIDEPAWSASAASPTSALQPANGNGRGSYRSNGTGRTAAPTLSPPAAPDYSPSVSSQVDELFGPLVDLPPEPVGDNLGTPIFEAIASAWFREDAVAPDPLGDNSGPRDWESPSDSEWRAAAERANQPEPPPSTSSGLPRRKPGNQLVPPPRARPAAEEPAERVPDRVRSRLSTYQRGLNQGRHRAPAPETDGW